MIYSAGTANREGANVDGGDDQRGLWGFLVAIFGTFATGLFGVVREGRKKEAAGKKAEGDTATAEAAKVKAETDRDVKLTPAFLERIQALEAKCETLEAKCSSRDDRIEQLGLELQTVRSQMTTCQARLRECKGNLKIEKRKREEAERSLLRVMQERDEWILKAESLADLADPHQVDDQT